MTHIKRTQISKSVPIARKGTAYVARASHATHHSVPVVIAVRNMLKLATTSKEVQYMINKKLIRRNGKLITDRNQPIQPFNTLSLHYQHFTLTLLPTGRFTLESKKTKDRIAKITGKKILKGNKTQITLHDGTTLLTKEKVTVGESIHLNEENKLIKIIKLTSGTPISILSGKNVGHNGTITKIDGKNAHLTLTTTNKEVVLNHKHIIAQ